MTAHSLPLPRQRAILLGASNLTNAFRAILPRIQELRGEAVDVLAALGHGRSYGWRTNVIGRELPSIRDCGIWAKWAREIELPTVALVTDLGNDLFYGATAAEILAWVDDCLTRLSPRCERVVVTLVPMANAAGISEGRYTALRDVCFRQCQLSLEQMRAAAAALNDGLAELAARHRTALIDQPARWYGWDPIHHRKNIWPEVWGTTLASWRVAPRLAQPQPAEKSERGGALEMHVLSRAATRAEPPRALTLRHWWRACWPESQRLFGREQHWPQPVFCGSDGARLSLY